MRKLMACWQEGGAGLTNGVRYECVQGAGQARPGRYPSPCGTPDSVVTCYLRGEQQFVLDNNYPFLRVEELSF